MKIETIAIEAVMITDVSGLDPIGVFWRNIGSGRGSVVITCYGCAWTAYWGAMGERTIQRFFVGADDDYLITKLVGITPLLKQRKADHAYLKRIIWAVKSSVGVANG